MAALRRLPALLLCLPATAAAAPAEVLRGDDACLGEGGECGVGLLQQAAQRHPRAAPEEAAPPAAPEPERNLTEEEALEAAKNVFRLVRAAAAGLAAIEAALEGEPGPKEASLFQTASMAKSHGLCESSDAIKAIRYMSGIQVNLIAARTIANWTKTAAELAAAAGPATGLVDLAAVAKLAPPPACMFAMNLAGEVDTPMLSSCLELTAGLDHPASQCVAGFAARGAPTCLGGCRQSPGEDPSPDCTFCMKGHLPNLVNCLLPQANVADSCGLCVDSFLRMVTGNCMQETIKPEPGCFNNEYMSFRECTGDLRFKPKFAVDREPFHGVP
mmetsp:Transcript_59849/g.170219  ORF Transcript_59849/g.170219 Transcript_59849/m.170219 type:complete len:329 (+) Transcript_59849:88-1074(+)